MGYWITSLVLIAFGIAGAMTVGRPFLLIGLAMLVLGPLRHHALDWPTLLGFVAYNVADFAIAPMYCSASSAPGGGSGQTACSSLIGIPWPADQSAQGVSAGAFAIANGVAIIIGVVVFALVLGRLWWNRRRGPARGSADAATA